MSRQRRALFVAGDGLNRTVAKSWLEMYGFIAVTACDGLEAAAILRSDPNFAALVVDAERGGEIDGLEVARIARDLNPSIGVLYTARHLHALPASALVDDALCLRSPHRPEQMIALLEELCQSGRTQAVNAEAASYPAAPCR